jgi:phage virion morphogenesis protein
VSNILVEVDDAALKAVLQRLSKLDQGPLNAFLFDIGEGIVSRTKQRFVTSTSPSGTPWLPLAQSTYNALANRLSKSNLAKDGRLNSKGASKIANKKILIGESRDLSRQFHVQSGNNSVLVFNSMIYAAIHQFGGQAGRNRKVTIPARPFFPITSDGQLYPQERKTIIDELNAFLESQISQK